MKKLKFLIFKSQNSTKARVKNENATDSSPDDSEPEGVIIPAQPAIQSDESDIDAKVARKKRTAKIEDSEVC